MAGYFLSADVLGFTNSVTNLSHESLSQHIESWISVVDQIKCETELCNVSIVSDTILALEDDSAEGLERLLKFSKLLLERSLANGFPIRGAITQGEITWGKMIYGKPVVDAFVLEKAQDWIGIACDVPFDDVPWSWDLACLYPVPEKSGPITYRAVVVWDICDLDTLLLICTSGGQTKTYRHESFKWEFWKKIRNTIEFSLYVRNSKKLEHSPSSYNSTEGRILVESKLFDANSSF